MTLLLADSNRKHRVTKKFASERHFCDERRVYKALEGTDAVLPGVTFSEKGASSGWVMRMPYGGPDLFTLLLGPNRVWSISLNTLQLMREILATVTLVHDLGYALMDISPENIVRHPVSGRLALIDLQTAIPSTDTLTNKNMYGVGKTKYMAPEVFYGIEQEEEKQSTVGKRAQQADMWSLGVMFLTFLVGFNLYDFPKEIAFIKGMEKNPVSTLNTCLSHSKFFHITGDQKKKCIDFLAGLLQVSFPEKRLTCSKALQHDLFKLSAGHLVPKHAQED